MAFDGVEHGMSDAGRGRVRERAGVQRQRPLETGLVERVPVGSSASVMPSLYMMSASPGASVTRPGS